METTVKFQDMWDVNLYKNHFRILSTAIILGLSLGAGMASAANELAKVLEGHVRELSDTIGERSVLRGGGLAKARAYVRGAFEAAGLSVTEQTYAYEGRQVANLIAELPGTAKDADPYVIGAHYDTALGTPGADDNASSIAVMLELARRAMASPPRAPLRFVAFTLEEPPAFGSPQMGSHVFVKRLIKAGEKVAGAIVLEMVGMTAPKQHYPMFINLLGYPKTGNFIGVIGNRASKPFGQRIVRVMGGVSQMPVESLFVWFDGKILPDTRLSDHAVFWDHGIPALMVTDTAYFRNPNYHLPTDTADTLDYDFMAKLVRALERAIHSFQLYHKENMPF